MGPKLCYLYLKSFFETLFCLNFFSDLFVWSEYFIFLIRIQDSFPHFWKNSLKWSDLKEIKFFKVDLTIKMNKFILLLALVYWMASKSITSLPPPCSITGCDPQCEKSTHCYEYKMVTCAPLPGSSQAPLGGHRFCGCFEKQPEVQHLEFNCSTTEDPLAWNQLIPLARDEKYISCKILTDNCKKHEWPKILAIKLINLMLQDSCRNIYSGNNLEDDAILGQNLARNALSVILFQNSKILRKILRDSLKLMHYLTSSWANPAKIVEEIHFVSSRELCWC